MIKRISIVLANYCPHCVPFSLQNAKKMSHELGVPLRVLDIEVPEQEKEADELVEMHGDWSEDYLIPQVFVEHGDRRVDHVLTGFSEAVPVTEASWNALFSSKYYKNLLCEQARDFKPFTDFVEKYLKFKGRCRRHCDRPTSFVDIYSDSDGIVGAYVCPDGYVSRVIYFSATLKIDWFKNFLISEVGEAIVANHDIRKATRHGWELGNDASSELCSVSPTGKIEEVYWTVYPQPEGERNRGVFFCFDSEEKLGCKRLFVQEINSKNKLCPNCR